MRRSAQGRSDAIARYGAEVRRVSGNYNDAVRQADVEARANGWLVVSDTSYEGYVNVPRDVMQGYSVMVDEALNRWRLRQPMCSSRAGSAVSRQQSARTFGKHFASSAQYTLWWSRTKQCLFRSAKAGKPTVVHGALDTIMAGLACGEVSLLAWKILQSGVDAFMTVTDAAAAEMMCMLAKSRYGDGPIVAGESAVAGLVGLAVPLENQTRGSGLAWAG